MVRFFVAFFVMFSGIMLHAQDSTLIPLLQTGHSATITMVGFGTSSDYFMSADIEGNLLSWNIESRQQIFSLSGFSGGISCFDYHEDSNLLVVGTYENLVFIYDLDSSWYEPLEIVEFVHYITTVDISPDGKKVAMGSADYSLGLWENGVLRTMTWYGDIRGLSFATDSRWLYWGDYNGNIVELNTEGGFSRKAATLVYQIENSVSEVVLSPNNEYLAFGAEGYDGGTIGVVDLRTGKLVYSDHDYIPFLQACEHSIQFKDEQFLLYITKQGYVNEVDIRRKKNYEYLHVNMEDHFAISPDGRWIAVSPRPDVKNSAKGQLRLYNSLEVSHSIAFQGKVDKPVRLMGQKGSSLLVEYESGIRQWNLEELSIEMKLRKNYDHEWTYYSSSPDLSYNDWDVSDYYFSKYIKAGSDSTIELRYLESDAYDVKCSNFSPNRRWYAEVLENGIVYVYDLSRAFGDSGFVQSWKYGELYAQTKVDRIVFSSNSNHMVILSDNIEIFNLDSTTARSLANNVRTAEFDLPAVFNPLDTSVLVALSYTTMDTFPYQGHSDYSSDWRSIPFQHVGNTNSGYQNIRRGIVYIYKYTTGEVLVLNKREFIDKRAEVASICYDSINKSILVAYTDGNIMDYHCDSGNYYTQLEGRLTAPGIRDMMLSDDSRLLFVMMETGLIQVFNRADLRLISSLIAMDDDEFIVMDPQGRYKRSKNASEAISFWNNGTLSRLSQYDKIFNQPHVVMKALGFASQDKIDLVAKLAYKAKADAVLKDRTPALLEFVSPDKIEYVTSDSVARISTKVTQRGEAPDYMKIWVNGVPVYADGEEPGAVITQDSLWYANWKVPMRRGRNVIRFVCYDLSGLESNERIVTIECNKKYVKPNLYIATVSVSHYKDSSMNLKYAVKDGRDLIKVYVDDKGERIVGFPSRFGKVEVDSFFDEKATIENIKTWKEKLLRTRPDDYVILYVSGHGLLDQELNFWFGTYNVDFTNPAAKGMSFYDLESLLVGIPAQQKLFLMDACHSGEVIDEEIVVDSGYQSPDGSRGMLIGYSSRGTQTYDLDGDMLNPTDVKQELFSNYESRSGATVISAAAGNSFALESPEWSNGIFTHIILGALSYRWADLNDDGNITVVELSKYVTSQVRERTNGLQVPNDRQENIDNNFRIW